MVESVNNLPCFKDLINVLIECFLIISFGYLSASFKLISAQAKDLNSYLTTFALPMIIFLNIAQMEFQTINLSFLFCMLSAKVLVFIAVTLLTLNISYPKNFGYAGSLAILTTQSNDFALGYPLIKSLYGESRQEMLSYLSLMAPIQLLILNPLGIVMLEYDKTRKKRVKKKCKHCLVLNPDSPGTPETVDSVIARSSPISSHGNLPSSKTSTLEQDQADLRQRSVTNLTNQRQLVATSYENDKDQTNRLETKKTKQSCNRNIKSLSLIIPARGALIDSESEESINTLDEFSNDNNYSTSQTHVKMTVAALDRFSPPISIHNFRVQNKVSPTDSIGISTGEITILPSDCTCQVLRTKHSMIDLSFLKSLALNPLIIASIVALLVNLLHGPELPKFVTRVSNTMAASFASPALFVVGASMYGKFELLRRNPNDLLLSSILVLTKVLLLPNLMRTLALLILPRYLPTEEVHYLVDFSYLYGLLPTAPTACIIAKQYNQLPNVVSISMLLSTFTSAPLILASAVIINPSTVINTSIIEIVISQTMKIASLITFVLVSSTLYAFWRSKKDIISQGLTNMAQLASRKVKTIRGDPTHIFLSLLALNQVIVGFGGLIWYFVDDTEYSSSSSSVKESRVTLNLTRLMGLESLPESGASTIVHDQLPLVDSPLVVDLGQNTTSSSSNFSVTATDPPSFSFQAVSLAQYIFSSYGLIMARFAVFCLIITLAAKKLGDRKLAVKVSAIFVRLHMGMAVCVLTWLVYDSSGLKHVSTEASLPSNPCTLYIRLVYNIIFLAISIPVFAFIIKSINKNRYKQETKGPSASIYKQRFVTSSTSLSSDASSAFTSNTNLDTSTLANVQVVQDVNNNETNIPPNDSLTVELDPANTDSSRRATNQLEIQKGNVVSPINQLNNAQPTSPKHYELDESVMNHHKEDPIKLVSDYVLQTIEFHKYSMLIVFMIIDSLHNTTTLAQKILCDQPYGTFRQIEVTNAAMEFGQGLLMYLIYRMNGLFSRLS